MYNLPLNGLSRRSGVSEEAHGAECPRPQTEPGRYHVQPAGGAAQPQVSGVMRYQVQGFTWVSV